MATQLEIVNYALRRLGCETIGSLADDSKRAKVMNDLYGLARKDTFELYPWSFSLNRITIAADATAPAFGYLYRFAIPADFVNVVSEYNEYKYKREGAWLLSDASELNVVYAKDEADPTIYTAAYTKSFALTLALEASYSLNQDKALGRQLAEEKFRIVEDARFADSKGSTPEDYEINDFLDVRL